MTDEMNPAMRDLFLGGEDEEAQDVQAPHARGPEPPEAQAELHELGAPGAYLKVDVRSNPDGSAVVWYHTNDRKGDGLPDRQSTSWAEILVSWSEGYGSVEQALEAVGPPRVEPGGRSVSIFVDGKPIG